MYYLLFIMLPPRNEVRRVWNLRHEPMTDPSTGGTTTYSYCHYWPFAWENLDNHTTYSSSSSCLTSSNCYTCDSSAGPVGYPLTTQCDDHQLRDLRIQSMRRRRSVTTRIQIIVTNNISIPGVIGLIDRMIIDPGFRDYSLKYTIEKEVEV